MAFTASSTTVREVLEQILARNPECKNRWHVNWSIHLSTNGAFPRELKNPCPVKIDVMAASLRCSMAVGSALLNVCTVHSWLLSHH